MIADAADLTTVTRRLARAPGTRSRSRLPGPLLLLALVAAVPLESAAQQADTEAVRLQGAILVIIDTARADHLSAYGHRRDTSPGLRALAARGVLFEQVVSYAPWTLPSVAAILAGDRFSRAYDVSKETLRRSLVEDIQRAGYTTAAITEGGFVSAHFGFDRGFGEFREERGAVLLDADRQGDGEGKPRQTAGAGGVKQTFSLARAWLQEHAGEPFFLLIHTYEPHTPYQRLFFTANIPRGNFKAVLDGEMLDKIRRGKLEIGDAERRYASALYDGGLRVADNELSLLMKQLNQIGLADRTLLVVTSDHGEELGERYPQHLGDHGHALFDEQILVPLVIADPTGSYARKRVTSQVRSVDILPTIADLLAVPLREQGEGRSLVPLMRGDENSDRIAFGGVTRLTPPRYFIRHEGYKYIESSPREGAQELSPVPPRIQLYDLRNDPGERQNLAAEDPERVRAYHRQLAEYLTLSHGSRENESIEPAANRLDTELRERLRSLGYLEDSE